MSNAIPFRTKRESAIERTTPALVGTTLDLPGPRVWDAKDLANFFRLSVHWVRKVSQSDDPPPRIRGVRLLRFDTHSKDFQNWIARRLSPTPTLHVDGTEGNG